MPAAFSVFDPTSVRVRAARPLPRLFKQWLTWLESVGGGVAQECFADLRGDWMDDYWIDYGSDLSEFFAFFLRLGEGSRVGVWYGKNVSIDESPVVLVGSEGDLEILGSTVSHFLARVAVDDDLDLYDLPPPPAFEPFRSALAAWLQTALGVDRHGLERLGSESPGPQLPELLEWFHHRGTEAAATAAGDPVVRAIHDEFEAVIDHTRLGGLAPWESMWFEVHIVSDHFRCFTRDYGLQPVQEKLASRVEPLARVYRRQRAATIPERGAWFSAIFRRSREGWNTPACNFEYPPEFAVTSGPRQPIQTYDGCRVAAEDYEVDLSAFPRSARWMPDWLADLIASGDRI